MKGASTPTRYLGTAHSAIAGRLSYWLGLHGPNLAIDTACSSSLVAVDLACQALRNGSCDMAFAGGVNLLLSPNGYVYFSRLRALSPTGRCHTFSDDADGYVRSEGCGMVLLKRLSDAQRDGDRILAVIRGTAVNQDGRSNGFTAPHGPAQQDVIRRAVRQANVPADTIDAVECHGTGTVLGDPIEVQALAAVYAKDRSPDRPVVIGSIKSNLGHTEAAAGIAGLLKAVVMLQHRTFPKTLHCHHPNRHIPWDDLNVCVSAQAATWRSGAQPRRIGVSSFGFSGTNAHVILEEPPAIASAAVVDEQALSPQASVRAVVVSGHSAAAVAANAGRVARHLEGAGASLSLNDVSWSLATARVAFRSRLAIAATIEDAAAGYPRLRDALRRFADTGRASGPAHATPEGHRPGKLAVLFTGQGSQRIGMGRRVYAQPGFDAFTRAFDAAVAACDAHLDRSLRAVMWAETADGGAADLLQHTRYAQPALFALETALYRQWEAWALQPDVVLGHSIGELVAAHVSGVFSLDDAARLVCWRGRLMAEHATAGGAMASVQGTPDDVRAAMATLSPHDAHAIGIAALNAPSQTVVSGDAAAVAALADVLGARGRKVSPLAVSHAFHSAHMDAMLEPFRAVAERARYQTPTMPVMSNVTGTLAETEHGELVTAEYWVRQVRDMVRFADCVRNAAGMGVTTFLECGPDAVLCGLAGAYVADDAELSARAILLPSLRRDDDDHHTLIKALCGLHAYGHAIDWRGVFAGSGARHVDLPTYAFQRQRYWLDAAKPSRADGVSAGDEQTFWNAVDEGQAEAVAEILGVPSDARGDLAPLIPYLAAWRQQRRLDAEIANWLYDESWMSMAAASPARPLGGMWALVAPEAAGEFTASLASTLEAAGAHTRTIAADMDRARLCDRLRDLPHLGGVLALTAVDEERGVPLAVTLVQALGDAGVKAPLWLVTRGAVGIDPADPVTQPLQALTWGFGRVVGLEHPERWGGLIDLPTRLDAHSATAFTASLSAADFEDQVAVRRGRRWVRRLTRVALPAHTKPWQPRATVLITGGTGTLGGHVARWLARLGAEHLVLASRRGGDAPGVEALRDELARDGTRVTFVACDVADRERLQTVLCEIDREDCPLTAVIHLAGTGVVTPIAELDPAAIDGELAAKVAGAWNLHMLLKARALDAFVVFGSIAGLWGSGGQAVYSAANAGLDAIARHRRSLGLPATVIAWGAWADSGMADADSQAWLRRRGVSPMAPDNASRALHVALSIERTSLAVANIDWARFATAFASLRPRPLLEQIDAARAALTSAGAPGSDEPGRADLFRATLLALPETARHARLIDLVASETAAVLGAVASSLDVRKGFLDLGLDSLMAVELKRRLHAHLGLALPATLVFDHPTIEDVAAWIGRELGVPGVAAPQSTAQHRGKTDMDYIAESLAMSDSEIERELKAIIDEGV